MSFASHIFREYDIRGIVGIDLDAGVAEAVGRAYGARALAAIEVKPSIVVVRDNRTTSTDLTEGLLRGLNAAGVDVIDIGTVPTPMSGGPRRF